MSAVEQEQERTPGANAAGGSEAMPARAPDSPGCCSSVCLSPSGCSVVGRRTGGGARTGLGADRDFHHRSTPTARGRRCNRAYFEPGTAGPPGYAVRPGGRARRGFRATAASGSLPVLPRSLWRCSFSVVFWVCCDGGSADKRSSVESPSHVGLPPHSRLRRHPRRLRAVRQRHRVVRPQAATWAKGAVGSVLAAVGTALPETIIPLIAILIQGGEAGDEVGIGAILGAPFMLSTLAIFVCGISVVIFALTQAAHHEGEASTGRSCAATWASSWWPTRSPSRSASSTSARSATPWPAC